MRLAPLLVLAATAAADRKDKKNKKSITNEAKHEKKQIRQEKKKKREKDASLKLKDPLLGLTKEIEDLAKLEDELTGKIVAPVVNTETESPDLPDNSFNLEQVDAVDEVIEEPVGEATKDCTQEMCQYELEPDFILEYKVNVPDDTTVDKCAGCSLTIKLIYEGTAWVAFALTTDGQMVGSEAVIGHPLMEGTEPGKYYLGGKFDGGIQPMPDEKQTLTNASISFENGHSVLQFEKLMKEEGEIEIVTGMNTFLWAHGEDNSMSTYHGNNRSPFQLNLLGVDEAGAASDETGDAEEIVADSVRESTTDEDEPPLPPCPPAYDQSHKYTAGDKVEVSSFIWECRDFPYDMYCNVPEFHPSLADENPNAEDLWMNAWSKSLGACAKPSEITVSQPGGMAAPVGSPTAKASLSPSEIVLTALPTQSPITDEGGLPFPVPELRYIEWKELGLHETEIAEALGYNRYSWNNLELLDLEEKAFEDLSASEKAGALALGFDQNTWDCFMSHYYGYYWSELEDANVDQYFIALGWTKHSWDNDGKAPDSDDKSWKELTDEEQLAATKICYTEKAWDWVPLPSW